MIISTRSCTETFSQLKAAPFNLIMGDYVNVRVTAINLYGESDPSEIGTGAVIQQVPDAPLNLESDPLVTAAGVIGLTWTQGISNGGTAVINYDIYASTEFGSFLLLKSAHTSTSYTYSGLVSGSNYKFKVIARNLVGTSAESSIVTIRAAKLPTAPTSVTTAVSNRNVIVTWTAQSDGGSPIYEYVVLVRESDGVTYTRDMVNCPGTDSNALTSKTCTIPFDSLTSEPYNHDWAASIWVKVASKTLVGLSQFSAAGNGAEILDQPNEP